MSVQIQRPTTPPYGWAADMFTVGVTGTNGKTSTTHLVAAALRAGGNPTLTISTTGYYLGLDDLDMPRTLQGFYESFRRLHETGGRYAAVECTSKGLAEGYAKRWRFDLGVFTNLSADHLQTHGSWEHYLAAKAQLFVHLAPGATAVLNAADQHALFLDQAIPADVHRRFFAAPHRGPRLRDADLEAGRIEVDASGTRVELVPSELADALGGEIRIRMVGDVFGENALAAALAAWDAGIEPVHIAQGLAACPPVPGRFEVLSRQPIVAVDYAHSPDALQRTCATARTVTNGTLVVVFGAGGDSTPQKRHPMGLAVGAAADVAVVTTDNPRHEDPQRIADMLVAGLEEGRRASVVVELDRRQAIARAIELAGTDGIVVVAGKGHETGQVVGEQTLPFSDRDEVLRLVAER